jgi:hypothetical protein
MGDVGKKLVSEPKAGNLLGELGALGLDERNPLFAVAPGEFLDLGER